MAYIYSSDLKTQVDEGQKKWTSGPDITNKVDVNEYIKFKLVEYEYFDAKDYDLWETFREDFAEFKEETFKNCNQLIIRNLRKCLCTRGVYVLKEKRTTVAKSLHNLILENEPSTWNQELIAEYFNSYGPFNSCNPMIKNFIGDSGANTNNEQAIDLKKHLDKLLSNPHSDTKEIASPEQSKNYGRELANLAKMYSEESKYCGENDNFDFKFTIFCDLCSRASVPKDALSLAYPTMLRGPALDHYYTNLVNNPAPTSFDQICQATSNYFEGPEYKRGVLKQWNAKTLQTVINQNRDKSTLECLQLLVKDLRHLQHGLDQNLRTDEFLHNKLVTACQGHIACRYACYKPADTVAGLINDLRSSITTCETAQLESLQPRDTTNVDYAQNSQAYFTDRRYYRQNPRPSSREPLNKKPFLQSHPNRPQNHDRYPTNCVKKCFVCGNEGCWSKNHTPEERNKSRKKFENRLDQFIIEYEGEESCSTDDAMEALLVDYNSSSFTDDDHKNPNSELFLTSFGPISSQQAQNLSLKLADRSVNHSIIPLEKQEITKNSPRLESDPFAYISSPARYTSEQFYGIMIDTGASQKSTAGYGQYLAYKQISKTNLDLTQAGAINVQFGIGSTNSIGAINVNTPIGIVCFHVIHADTPFLLCLKDMDNLKAYYNNVTNKLITPSITLPVTRRFGHPFLLWEEALTNFITHSLDLNPCYLTVCELQRLHRRFGHPSAERLLKLLERSGHEASKKSIDKLTKFCKFCQKYGRSPGRFKFTLREDLEFNHSILVDIMYIEGSPVLHIIDEATHFQAARWLQNLSARHCWDILRSCWIDTYLGPPDFIIHDAGTNFTSREFQQCASSLSISTKTVPVEAHWSVGLVERAHPILKRSYEIINEELKNMGCNKDLILQMAVKAVNDTSGPEGLVPTLLVFGAYPKMVDIDPPAPSITQRATVIRKAMAEISKLRAKIVVNSALNHRNGPDTSAIHDLPLNSDVLVWREGNIGSKGEWTGPHKLIALNGETCTVQLERGPTNFRSTTVKPYFEEQSRLEEIENKQDDNLSQTDVRRNPNRERKLPTRFQNNLADISVFIQNSSPFENSRRKEINGLLEKGVFEMVDRIKVPQGLRIFNSRFVDEIKHPGTEKAFEKSRLVVQAYNDQGKDMILTQSPTLQRVSQRIILALTPTLKKFRPDMKLYLRDISQAYVQSTTYLNRNIFIRPPPELKFEKDILLKVLKPLYGIPEAGNHWFATYHDHHIQKLKMSQSTFDPCLFFTNTNGFGVVGLQTDDTLFLANSHFAKSEEEQLQQAGFSAKKREMLSSLHPLKFNGGQISLLDNSKISLTQENQCKNLNLISTKIVDLTSSRGHIRKAVTPINQYVAQRARGSYIATVCQPEATFDLSFAAQVTEPQNEDIKNLNKRIQWQMENATRGINFVPLDSKSLKLVIFTDSSFANNKDLSSQIGYVIVLADDHFSANIIHWSSIKCKRVTRSVLASELYAIVHGFDIGAAIRSTIKAILQLAQLPLILCTDSKSLYECLVKLGTLREKRLMVDLMCLRQSYERREITEVKWISGDSNPADAMTKSKPCMALRKLIDTNKLDLHVEEWVERE